MKGAFSDGILTLNKKDGNIYIAISIEPESTVSDVTCVYDYTYSNMFVDVDFTLTWNTSGNVSGQSATFSTNILIEWLGFTDETSDVITETIDNLASTSHTFSRQYRTKYVATGVQRISFSNSSLNISNGQNISIDMIKA